MMKLHIYIYFVFVCVLFTISLVSVVLFWLTTSPHFLILDCVHAFYQYQSVHTSVPSGTDVLRLVAEPLPFGAPVNLAVAEAVG